MVYEWNIDGYTLRYSNMVTWETPKLNEGL